MDPGVIKRLDEVVVNRIAAGEVIQRPANALKEMIENSLDAKSTFIQICVKSGGLKFLQIQDNGTGIRKNDLEIVCERFTTSKLQKFEDLSNIATFGFRGEALASISHVAHLAIQTKTNSDECAYKATYEDGKIKSKPKPCAGNQGTTITVEDLFYNVPQRRQVLRVPNEEFQKISDVVSKYSIHNSKVGFMLKKFGENQPSIKTSPNSTTEENIKTIYGTQIGKELIEIQYEDNILQFKLKGFITNVNYSGKRGIFLIFINHRLVESQSLKTSIDSVYSTYLAKGSYPFIYVSLELEPTSVDVNVHPTKHEVHFLNEDDINEKIKQYLETKLLGSNNTRTFYKQMRLPGSTDVTIEKSIKGESNGEKIYAKDLIRTDSREQKLEKFLNSSQNITLDFNKTAGSNNSLLGGSFSSSIVVTKRKNTKLTSILNIRKKIEDGCSTKFKTILRDIVFVGIVDKKYGMFQYESKLFLCNTLKLSYELFYQLVIYNFENFKEIIFEPALSIKSLALIALDMQESGWVEEDGPKIELANHITEILIQKGPILKEYFGIKISDSGNIETLPILLDNHKPSMSRLPHYILRLATDVDWDDETECFKTFCHETANFYSYVTNVESETGSYKWCIEHVIYPAFKEYLIPNNKFNEYLFELTSLQQLFKVFERC